MIPHPLDKDFKYLKLSIPERGLVLIELNRPKKRNALHSSMWKEIGQVFTRLGRCDDGSRCIILTGSGKAFSAGIDVTDSKFFSFNNNEEGDTARRGLAFLPQIFDMQRCFTAVEDCALPVIAAIHGSCIGAGIDLACCCDVRLAAPGSVFSVREVKIGLAADIGTLQRLPKIAGNDSRVRELCLTGENFDHNQAVAIGFVSRLSPNVLADAIQLGSKIASNSPIAVMGTKQSLLFSRDHSVKEGLEHVARHNALALMTDDIPTAFMASSKREKAEFSSMLPFSRL
jgi:delta(3,5)-delta(2,4)-dienoyl-CoA isomerase